MHAPHSVGGIGTGSKIRAVDALLRKDAAARRVIREVHPELSFWAWNDGVPMQAAKKKREGRAERLPASTQRDEDEHGLAMEIAF